MPASVNQARKAFESENYALSLKLYIALKHEYNTKAFDYNIEICRKNLEESTAQCSLFQENKQGDKLSQLNNFFDKVYLVNLKSDVDSRIRAEHHLSECNIEYELFEATNGYRDKPLEIYNEYSARKLGSLKRFPDYNCMEIKRGSHFINSPGAIGYILTYREILKDAISKKYNSILILEDDVAFVHNARQRIDKFLMKISKNWKIINLGSSQYGWEEISVDKALAYGFYHPTRVKTCGSFAIGINCSVYQEIIDLISYFEAPFDHLPLGEIYQSASESCYTAFPAIAIPDVTSSNIRHSRDQIRHSEKMKWPIEMIEFPFRKPVLQILLKNSKQLKYSSSFKRFYERGYILNFYKTSKDGLRPVHENQFSEFEATKQNNPDDLSKETDIKILSDNNTIKDDQPFTEEDFHNYFLKQKESQISEINSNVKFLTYVPGRATVVIPTHGRSENLTFAIESCIHQTYYDVEIIVVSDNNDTKIISHVKEIEKNYKEMPNLKFIYHSENRNGSAARNTGVMNSSGEYISFLDDDDIYEPNRLEESIKLLSSLPSYYGGTYCGYLGWNSSELDTSRFTEADLFENIISLKHKRHYIHTNTVTVRRSVFFAVNGFNESYARHQDLEYHLRILLLYKLKPLPKLLVRLKPNPVPNSNLPNAHQLKEIKKILLKDFLREITNLGENFSEKVFSAHNDELLRYSDDTSGVVQLSPLI